MGHKKKARAAIMIGACHASKTLVSQSVPRDDYYQETPGGRFSCFIELERFCGKKSGLPTETSRHFSRQAKLTAIAVNLKRIAKILSSKKVTSNQFTAILLKFFDRNIGFQKKSLFIN